MIAIDKGPFSFISLFLLIFLTFWIISKFILKRKPNVKRKITDLIFIIYLTGLVLVTMFPLSFGQMIKEAKFPLEAYLQVKPFHTIIGYLSSFGFSALIQLLGNIILLVPLAVYINTFFKWNWKKNLLFAILFSIGIEATQGLWDLINRWPYKKVDIDDVICNSLGYMLTLIFMPFIKNLYHKI